ncbi:hypothetical protein GCM10028807_29860 [Spirosoma daeguense]
MMKNLWITIALLIGISAVSIAQNQPDSGANSRPLVNEQTKQDIRQEAARTEEKLEEEVDRSRSYQETHQLNWFQPNTIFGGGGLGFGAASGQVYLGANLRAGYFFQPGFAAGLRYDADRLIGNKYRSRQIGAFVRYYPFRTRISSFVGASLNSGREFSENIPTDVKARYTSVGLELGLMAWIFPRLGAELAYESSFYNKLDPTASRGKGNRLKLGVNYYFGRVGRSSR